MNWLSVVMQEWRERREQAALLRSLAFMGPEQAGHIAADVGLGLDELRSALQRGLSSSLLGGMLQARGLVAGAIPAASMRDIERTCTACPMKATCRRELNAGTAAAHAANFCPNDEPMTELLRLQAA